MKPIHSLRFLSAVAALLACGSAFGQTLFDLSDINISGDDQNAFAAVSGGFGGHFSYDTDDKLVFTNGGTSAGNGDYFVLKLDDFVRLENVGDAIKLSFSVTAAGLRNHSGSSQPFRFGLFDVGSATDTGFSSADGYSIFAGRANASSNSGLFERNGSTSNLWSGSASTRLSTTEDAPDFNISITNPVIINSELTLELLDGDRVRIASTVNGASYEEIFDANVVSFNAISFFTTYSSGSNSLTFDELSLQMVPEPTLTALLAVALCAPTALILRRRNRHKSL